MSLDVEFERVHVVEEAGRIEQITPEGISHNQYVHLPLPISSRPCEPSKKIHGLQSTV